MNEKKIIEIRDVWVAWTNTDLTEGRGREVPYAICETEATARRRGAKKSVQGCDCRVSKEIAVRIEGERNTYLNPWYAPCNIEGPTKEDKETQKRIDDRLAAEERAKSLGLSETEIQALRT